MIPAVLLALAALAHDGAPRVPVRVHVDDHLSVSALDLHPQLSQGQLTQLTRELGAATAFVPLGGAGSLGRGAVEARLELRGAHLHDHEPHWNHATSHPTADDRLGHPTALLLRGSVGVTEGLGLEATLTGDPRSNWGVLGVAGQLDLAPPVVFNLDATVGGEVGLGAVRLAAAWTFGRVRTRSVSVGAAF